MRIEFKRAAALLLIVISALALCACSAKPGGSGQTPQPKPSSLPDNSMRITLTVDANGMNGNGLLMNAAFVTAPKGCVFSDIFRLLDLYGIPIETDTVDGVNRITSVKGVENGAAGIYSYWLVTVNGNLVTEGVDTLKLDQDDVVRLFFTKDNGADAGVE